MTTVSAQSPTHHLWRVHRTGSAALGAVILVFGVLGFSNRLDYFSTTGTEVLGLSTNGLLSSVSVVVGTMLLAAAFVGGSRSSDVNVAAGALFLLGGLVNLFLIGTPYNVLAFAMPNVVFSFVVGMVMLGLGLYGRGSGNLPDDNPYRQVRTERNRRSALLRQEESERRRAMAGGVAPITGRERRRREGSTALPR